MNQNLKTKRLRKARELTNKLRFHVLNEQNSQENEFLKFPRDLLPSDKYSTFYSIYKLYCGNGVIDVIFGELFKVFGARDSYTNYNVTGYNDEFSKFIDNSLKVKDFIKTMVWDRQKTNPNDVVVVDMPTEQITSRPKPYMYFVSVFDILDFDTNEDGSIRWIVFYDPKYKNDSDLSNQTYIRITSFAYETVKIGKEADSYIVISSVEHQLGYCPVQWIIIDDKDEEEVFKYNPLTKYTGNLSWLKYFGVSKKALDTHSAFPIYSGYETDCDFEGADGLECSDGLLKRDGIVLTGTTGSNDYLACPKCATRNMTGPGSFVVVPQPDGEVDMRNPIQMLTADVESLNYNVKEGIRIEQELYNDTVGIGGSSIETFSVNKDQLMASINSKQSVLEDLKVRFEKLEKWMIETLAKLQYGDLFTGCEVSYGSEFYLHTEDEFLKFYLELKDKGAGNEILDAIQDEYYRAKFRDNDRKLCRINIQKHLDPLRHINDDDVLIMFEQGSISYEIYMLKVNLTSFILRFEREQGFDIVDFGKNIGFDKKIEIITDKLKEYTNEYKGKDPIQPETND